MAMSTKEDVVNQLKKAACVRGKMRTWVSDLSEEKLYEIYLRLRSNESSRSIARHAQEIWRVNPSSSIHSISQGVTKFCRRISHLLIIPPPVGNDPISLNLYQGFDEESTLGRMERMAQDIEARINRMIAEEQETGIKYANLNKDIQALASLRKSILKQRDWELIHGDSIQAENERNMEKNIKRRFDGLLEYLGDDGQKRLICMMHNFLEMADKIAVPMNLNAEGKFVVVDKKD